MNNVKNKAMDYKKLQALENKISSGKIQQSKTLFGGANLIIQDIELKTKYKNHHQSYPQDVLVFTKHHREYSWLVFQLKAIFGDEIDSMNKYVFYPMIGEIINKGEKKKWSIEVTMLNVVNSCLKLKLVKLI